jgi:REP element-mobilizing transposase RayT
MTRALRILYANAYYHVTCRGNERKAIFRDDTDRSLFLDKLNSSREIYGVEIEAELLPGLKMISVSPESSVPSVRPARDVPRV